MHTRGLVTNREYGLQVCRSPTTTLSTHPSGLMFLTRLPCPGWCDHHPAYLMRSMAYFPIIGAMVGAWAAVFFIAAATLWDQHIAVVLSTFASVWLTGL